MPEHLPGGGLIRKMWIAEAEHYRDHLLRLDRASRRGRFGGAVSDDVISRHAELASAWAMWFTDSLPMAFCAAPPS